MTRKMIEENPPEGYAPEGGWAQFRPGLVWKPAQFGPVRLWPVFWIFCFSLFLFSFFIFPWKFKHFPSLELMTKTIHCSDNSSSSPVITAETPRQPTHRDPRRSQLPPWIVRLWAGRYSHLSRCLAITRRGTPCLRLRARCALFSHAHQRFHWGWTPSRPAPCPVRGCGTVRHRCRAHLGLSSPPSSVPIPSARRSLLLRRPAQFTSRLVQEVKAEPPSSSSVSSVASLAVVAAAAPVATPATPAAPLTAVSAAAPVPMPSASAAPPAAVSAAVPVPVPSTPALRRGHIGVEVRLPPSPSASPPSTAVSQGAPRYPFGSFVIQVDAAAARRGIRMTRPCRASSVAAWFPPGYVLGSTLPPASK
jgi:hypothetical protein